MGGSLPELSSLEGLPAGVTVKPLREAVREDAEALEAVLGQRAQAEAHPFVALNAALLEEGAFVQVRAGRRGSEPRAAALPVVSGESAATVLASPRIVVVAGANSEAALVEMYAGVEGGASFTNAVTEVVLGENARLHHYKLQAEPDAAFHLASLHAEQARDSRLASHSFALGGGAGTQRGARSCSRARAASACSTACTWGVARSTWTTARTWTTRCPAAPAASSIKACWTAARAAPSTGACCVRQDAQSTDASQTNRNLLLSEEALVDTRPQLEILADDVKCAHGAAVGRLDEQALFYLRARGIPQAGGGAAAHLRLRQRGGGRGDAGAAAGPGGAAVGGPVAGRGRGGR